MRFTEAIRGLRRVCAVAALLVVSLSVAYAQVVPHVRGVDARPLVESIRSGIQERGGDPDRSRFHLVFAVMTSHFGADPGHAEGLRRLVSDCIARFADTGDRVSLASWELDTWDLQGPRTVSSRKSAVSEIGPMLPRTPRAGSIGGHDTEQSLVTLWDRLRLGASSSDTVVVVLSTEEASMLPPGGGGALLGANAPRYKALLAKARRYPAVRLPFESSKTDGSGAWTPRTATAFLVAPMRLAGRPATLARGLGRNGPEIKPPQWLYWLRIAAIGLLVLVGLGLLGWLLSRPLAGRPARIQALKVADREWQIPAGTENCKWFVVGEGCGTSDPERTAVAETVEGTPPQAVLLELRYDSKSRSVVAAPMAGVNLKKGTALCAGAVPLEVGPVSLRLSGRLTSSDPLTPDEMFVASVKVVAS